MFEPTENKNDIFEVLVFVNINVLDRYVSQRTVVRHRVGSLGAVEIDLFVNEVCFESNLVVSTNLCSRRV